MNTKRFILSTIAIFIFTFAYEFLVHGILLQDAYKQTAHLWRTQAESQEYCLVAMAITLAASAIITYIFTRNYQAKGIKEGLRFGLYIGLFMGILQIGSYPYMPIPLSLAAAWFASALIRGICSGLLLSLVYKK